MTTPIRSILLLHSGALGDTVLHLRLAQVFQRAMGEGAIGWLGRDSWLPIVRRCQGIDRLVGLDAMRAHRLFAVGQHTDPDMAEWLGSFDLILNSLAPDGSPAAARLHRLARRAAITYETAPQAGTPLHITRQWLDRIAALLPDLPELSESLVHISQRSQNDADVLLHPAPDDLAEARTLLRAARIEDAASRRLVLLHPGSGGRRKCWPIGNYLRLVELLRQQAAEPVVVLGPVEMEQLADRIESLRQRCPLITDVSLSGLMGLVGSAAAYVGNDSGPTHLAAAMGVPTVALFGPTDPRIWQPIGPKVTVMTSQEYEVGWGDLTPEAVALASKAGL